MLRWSHVRWALVLSIGLHLSAREAVAQGSLYLGGSAFADIKRFGSTDDVYYLNALELSLDATGAGGGFRIGTLVHPRVSLELAIDAGTETEVDAPDPYLMLAIYPPFPLPRGDRKASTRFLAVSTVVGFHPPARGRLRLGYLAGFSFIRATYQSDYPDFVVLPAALSTSFFSWSSSVASPPSGSRIDGLPTIFPPPRFARLTQTDLTGGAILGFEAAVDLTRHLAVVPEIRALMLSTPNNGPGLFLVRPGVGVRWTF
jgi:hypothetical protein